MTHGARRRTGRLSLRAAALALQAQDSMTSVVRQVFDISAQRLIDTQARVGEQQQQRIASLAALPFGRGQQPAQHVTSEPRVSPRSLILAQRTCPVGELARTPSATR